VIDFDMDMQSAIEAGKIHHQWLPDRIVFEEECFDAKTIQVLEKMGHTLYPVKNIGSLMGIRYYQEKRLLEGGSDSSSGDGGAAGF
jgi:gamma-glutamyltranspeptidase/glutathione hydrolase